MFGWGKKKEPLKGGGGGGGGGGITKQSHEGVDEGGEEEPSLDMKALQRIIAENGVDNSLNTGTTNTTNNTGDDDNISSVDENDEQLLAELHQVVNDNNDGHDNDDNDNDDTTNANPTPMERLQQLQEELREEMEAYDMFKKEGCKDEAAEILPKIKALKEQVAALQKELNLADPRVLAAATARRTEFKQAAQAWLKAGNKDEARKWLQAAKSLDGPIEIMEGGKGVEGFQVPPAATLPPSSEVHQDEPHVAPAPVATKAKSTAAVPRGPPATAPATKEQPAALPPAKDPALVALENLRAARAERHARVQAEWTKLTDTLKEEVHACNAKGKELKDTDKMNAVLYLRRQKESMTLLETAVPLQKSGAECPKWSMDAVVEMKRVFTNADVGDLELAVNVVKGLNMVNEKGEPYGSVMLKIRFEYTEETAKVDYSSGYGDRKGRDIMYNWVQKLPITRKSSFKGYLERKKLKIEVYDARGLFRSLHLLGRVDVPLDVLLHRCTLSGVYPVLNERKVVGPSLEVTLKMRTPLLSADEQVVQEKFVQVQQWPPAGPSDADRRDAELEANLLATVAQGPVKVVSQNPFQAWKGNAKDDPNNAERMVSVAVLEHMAKEANVAGDEAKARAAQLRALAIRAWIKDGHMSIADYHALVKRAAEEEKALAAHLKTKSKEDAIECLRRVKIMSAEIDSATQAPAAQQPAKAAPAPTPSPTPAPSSTATAKPPVVEKAPPPAVKTGKPAAVAAQPKPQPAAAAEDELPHRSVDNIVSIAVIGWELEELAKQPPSDETEHRKMELEGKKMDIMTQIQIGAMQMEDYAAALKERIVSDKALAKQLGQQGNKAEALYCLQRAKKMEEELNS